ncbi:hypothetical protein Apa02nite_026340 [Actinoplanes palleronii]|uniref:Uncharacterized protein n=1 Tax=Actinoplanes palleronii TaxID=113570 RepID=A0ABQ4B774_9ACTN|nr:hypothetical protein Apa02nite_026340 [Actinoplanes palleronii]
MGWVAMTGGGRNAEADAAGAAVTGDSGGLAGNGSGGAPQAAVNSSRPTARGMWRVWGDTRSW